jgi:hypothetical protein
MPKIAYKNGVMLISSDNNQMQKAGTLPGLFVFAVGVDIPTEQAAYSSAA